MHIPDGILSLPAAITTAAASVGCVGAAVKNTKNHLEEKQVPFMGVMAAFIFAAQMINFPVALGTSGHLIGAFLAAVVLGPWVSSLIITSILIVQALFFGDGGIIVLGANVLNMAVVANFAGYWVYRRFLKAGKLYSSTGLVVGGWVSVLASALAAAVEIALSGRTELLSLMSVMLFWHALIGLGEGFITLFVIKYIAKVRKDLLHQNH